MGAIAASVAASMAGLPVPWHAITAMLFMAFVGFLDDWTTLPVLPRLTAQFAAGATLGGFLGGPEWAAIGALTAPLLVNVVNFMDGINGITASTMTLWGSATTLAGVLYESGTVATIGALVTGAALGFLPWNSPKAHLFLGDVGSYFFGMAAASGVLLAGTSQVPMEIVVAPLALYLVDVFATLTRRALRGESLTQPHRDHAYQRLQRAARSHAVSSAWMLGLSSIVATSWFMLSMELAAVVTLAISLAYLLAPTFVEHMQLRTSPRTTKG